MMHKGVITKTEANSFFPVWIRKRELRQRLPLAQSDSFCKSLYSSISPCHSWGGGETSECGNGLFSLEFSPDGTLLVAGYQRNSFLIFDPLSRKLIRTVHNAHTDVVTNVKFLDSQIFATGGIDKTVFLWDIRNLKSQCRTLEHSSMITNIEYSRDNGLLITSGLDGITYLWDIRNLNQRGEINNTFMSHVLLRLRLTPDETKMIISTARGYLLIVHELDFNTFAQDLDGFKLERFECAYLHQTLSATCQNCSRFLSSNRRKNRVEIVADFPNAGGHNVISALEIHPQGWSAFTRSSSEATGREWTCVHDIQEREPSEGGTAPRGVSGDERPPCPQQDDAGGPKRQRLERINDERCSAGGDVGGSGPSSNDSGPGLPGAAFSLERGALKRSGSSADTAQAWSPPPTPSSVPPDPLELAGSRSNQVPCRALDPSLPRPNLGFAHFNRKVHKRFPRLTHYIEEPNFTEWYIECLAVSADGRLVCSPLQRGIRLLAFSPECSEQSVSWCGTYPRRLHELITHTSHSNSVLCIKFSPHHCLLVSGCTDGKLTWYQPVV